MGVGIDEITKLFRLEATTAVTDAVGPARLQHFGGPRGSDEIIFQKGRVPEVKIDRETVDLDMHHPRGGKIPAQIESLESLTLI